MALTKAHLVGAWTFVDWSITTNPGTTSARASRPFQPAPSGYIVYAADGIMSAVIQAGGRAKFPSADIRKRPDAEKANAFDGYFHYAGTWHVDGQNVVHTVTTALNPNMIGTQQVRHVHLNGDTLTLSAEEALEGGKGTRRHELIWQRHKTTGT
ncbi:MAG: lipocalin-like domain-containing protein [Rhodospirillaceae bacterium]|nr:lipocalin-like domain-containing protein [Rhodospirillaceae bacterium]